MFLAGFPALAKGALSFAFPRFRTVHGYANPLGTVSAESCYSIFLRHLALLRLAGVVGVPPVVAELGPGSSVGVGIAALLAGARRFMRSTWWISPIRRPTSMLSISSPASSGVAPQFLLLAFTAAASLTSTITTGPTRLDLGPSQQWEERVAAIRDDVAARSHRFVKIATPWTDRAVTEDARVDWIISQSVLEHVDALQNAYVAMARWLKPEEHASHLIDFSSHRMTKEWNGHWAIDDLTWRIMRGKRPYLLNRRPYTDRVAIAAECGLAPVAGTRNKRFDGLIPDDFAPRFRKISDEDARAEMVFLILRNNGDQPPRGPR